ncbi:hypothetical protein ACJMK2_026700 [Sinanodonta woodiana]|uniref:ZP domain-containing protein n=1 Tax=Sinanodonta woodiana TaxID=1069815 RepID=A0ABD3XKV1_SINWO
MTISVTVLAENDNLATQRKNVHPSHRNLAYSNHVSCIGKECTQDDTIIITGQDNKLYGSIYAEEKDSHAECTVNKTVHDAVVLFTVGECNVSMPVSITVMQEEQNTNQDMVIGGRNVTMYVLKCSNVRRGGLDITQSININETDQLNTKQIYQKEVDMQMRIMLKGGGNGPGLNGPIVIGQELQLSVHGNGGFAFMAKSCIATDGYPHYTHSKNLIIDGINKDPATMSAFSNYGDTNHTEIRASLFAFHFLNKNTVTIICNITVCQDDDSSCPFPIPTTSSRRKRSAHIEPHTDTLETSFSVIDSYTNPGDKTNDSSKSSSSTRNDRK